MPGQPAVTVLLSAYNDLRFLPAAIESVLRQTFSDFELLAIDDGSCDGTGEYLDRLSDPRIRVIHNDRNIGLTASLNRGLDLANTRYTARMDADDICEPERLALQLGFLDAHPDVGILGTGRRLIDEAGNDIAVVPAVPDDLSIRWKCLLGNPFAHPSVMLRRSVLEQHHLRYDESFRTAQDYELWTRLLPLTTGANLPEPLIRYRIRPGLSRLSRAEQMANHDRIVHAAFLRLLPEFALSLEDVRQLRGRYGGVSAREPDLDPSDMYWLIKYQSLFFGFLASHPFAAGRELLLARQREKISRLNPAMSIEALG